MTDVGYSPSGVGIFSSTSCALSIDGFICISFVTSWLGEDEQRSVKSTASDIGVTSSGVLGSGALSSRRERYVGMSTRFLKGEFTSMSTSSLILFVWRGGFKCKYIETFVEVGGGAGC